MKLIVKFNLVLFLVFAIGFAAVGFFANRLLQRNAKEEIVENARIMMEAALAVRAYTSTQIKPLLETQIKYSFLPQIVPAYSANQYFGQLHKKFPEYAYKEATLNPTNPMDRATDWEADIVNAFRQSQDLTEQIGERDHSDGTTGSISLHDRKLGKATRSHSLDYKAQRLVSVGNHRIRPDQFAGRRSFFPLATNCSSSQRGITPNMLPALSTTGKRRWTPSFSST